MKISRRAYGTAIRVILGIVIATGLMFSLVDASESTRPPNGRSSPEESRAMATKYVGIWMTPDRHIRHELLPNGRYDEARGNRESAYRGRYEIRGNHIDYWDDTGFTADGIFVSDDELHHGGMVFHRRK